MTEQKLAGKYKILAELGRGGMGVVYKAYHEALDRTVAIKCLNKELATNEEFLGRFSQEARTIAKMGNHENIVHVYDIEDFQGEKFIVMEFIEGESLSDKLKREGRLPYASASKIIIEAARGLAHAHRNGVIHRDIKPDNIMLTRDGRVKVMDFGIARVSGASQKTQTGMAIGTPHYMSPEQIRGQGNIDARSDLYSLGIVLYYCVVGVLPYDDPNPFTLAMKHIHEMPPAPSLIYQGIHPQMEAIIQRSIAKRPDDRFQSAADLEQALSIFTRGGTIPAFPAAGDKTNAYERVREDSVESRAVTMAGQAVHSTGPQRMISPQAAHAPTMQQQRRLDPADTAVRAKSKLWVIVLVVVLALAGGAGAIFVTKPAWARGLIGGNQTATTGIDELQLFKDVDAINAALAEKDTVKANQLLTKSKLMFGDHPDLKSLQTKLEEVIAAKMPGLDDPTYRKLEELLTIAKYDLTRLASTQVRLDQLKKEYPNDKRLPEFELNLGERLTLAKALDATKREVVSLTQSGEIGRARDAIRKLPEALSGEAPELQRLVNETEANLLQTLKRTIRGHIESSKLAEGREELAKARKLFPDNATEWAEEERRLNEVEGRVASAEQRTRDAADLQKQFDATLAAKNFEEARVIGTRLKATYPDIAKADYTKQVNDAIAGEANALLAQSEKMEKDGVAAAQIIAVLETAQKLAPTNPKIQNDLYRIKMASEKRATFDGHMAASRAALAEGELTKATEAMNQALMVFPTDPDVTALRGEIEAARNRGVKSTRLKAGITDTPDIIRRRKAEAPPGFIYVPGGNYIIGSDESTTNAKPAHVVAIKGFYLSQSEVTVRDYNKYTEVARTKGKTAIVPDMPASDIRPDWPVTGISRRAAEDYCLEMGVRLPTEFEWEAAARTIEAWPYPLGGAQFDVRRVNTFDNGSVDSFSTMSPAWGSFPDGLRDDGYKDGTRVFYNLTGNVSEWTANEYRPYPGSKHVDGEYNNQRGVIRGGSYNLRDPLDFLAYVRRSHPVGLSQRDLGFRVARDVGP